jgi:hypothetical protein
MARQEVDIGIEGNDGTGDSIRESFRKVNENFREIYAVVGKGGQIGFTSLGDTPDSLDAYEGGGQKAFIPIVKQDATGIDIVELASDSADPDVAGDGDVADTIEFIVDVNGKLIMKVGNIRLINDATPTLGGPFNGAGQTIGSIGTTAEDAANFNRVHGTAITQDDLVIDKKFADKAYISRQAPGETINIPDEPTSGSQYTKTFAIIEGENKANIANHGLTRGSDGAAYKFNTVGAGLGWSKTVFDEVEEEFITVSYNDTDEDGNPLYSAIQDGDTVYIGVLDENNLGFWQTPEEAQQESPVDRERNRLKLTPLDPSSLSITDLGYDSNLEGFFLSQQVVPRNAVTRRQGDTMEGPLYLYDHPGDLKGAGTPSGVDDLQAVSKLYVDAQSTESSADIYVSTVGDDDQLAAPAGKEGSSLAYAYRTIGAAMRKAEAIQIASPYEPGPYMQDIVTSRTVVQGEPKRVERARVSSFGHPTAGQGYAVNTKTIILANIDFIIAETLAWIHEKIANNETTTQATIVVDWTGRVLDVPQLEQDLKNALNAGILDNLAAQADFLSKRTAVEYYNNEYQKAQAGLVPEVLATAIEFMRGITGSVIVQSNLTPRQSIYEQQFITFTADDPEDQAEKPITSTTGTLASMRNIIYQGVFSDEMRTLNPGANYKLYFTNTVLGVTQGFVDQGNPQNRDLRVGKVIRGKISGALGRIVSYFTGEDTDNNPGSTDDVAELELLKPIDFIQGEPLEYGNIVNQRNIAVKAETGTYYEDCPIRVPRNVSLVGDEMRRTIIRPAKRTSQSPWADVYFYRDRKFDGLAGTDSESVTGYADTNLPSAGEAYYDPLLPEGSDPSGYFGRHYLVKPEYRKNVDRLGELAFINPGNFGDGATLIEKNIEFIKEEQIAFIKYRIQRDIDNTGADEGFANVFNPDFAANTAAQDRYNTFVETVLQAIIKDLREGKNFNVLEKQAEIYFDIQDYPDEDTVVKSVLVNIKQMMEDIVSNIAWSDPAISAAYRPATPTTQYINTYLTADTDALVGSGGILEKQIALLDFAIEPNTITDNTRYNCAKSSTDVDMFLMNDATIIRQCTIQGHGGFMVVLDPEGQILTKSPYIQTGSSFSQSINRQAFRGGMLVDAFCANTPVVVTEVDSPFRIKVETTEPFSGLYLRKPQTPAPFYIDGVRYQVNDIDTYNNTALSGNASAWLVLDITSGPIDPNDEDGIDHLGFTFDLAQQPNSEFPITLQTAGNRSMLGNDFTQVNDLGYGLVCLNGGISEMVSMFTYYCHASYHAANGGQIRSVGGSSCNGVFGLVAEGSDPNEVPDDVVLVNDMVQAALTFEAAVILELDTAYNATPGDIVTQLGGPTGSGTIVYPTTGKLVYLKDVTGSFASGNEMAVGDGVTQTATGITVDDIDSSGYINAFEELSMYVYDVEHVPSNKGEVEYYHDDGATPLNRLVRYELASIERINGLAVDGYQIAISDLGENSGSATSFGYRGLVARAGDEITPSAANQFPTLVITKTQLNGGSYNVQVIGEDEQRDFKVGDTFVVYGSNLGGTDTTHDATIVVESVNISTERQDLGLETGTIRSVSITGAINVIANFTPQRSGQVYKISFSTSDDAYANDGLLADIPGGKPVIIRANSTHQFDEIESTGDLTIRPSTAINFQSDPTYTYRSISFGSNDPAGDPLGPRNSLTGFDASYDWIRLNVDSARTTEPLTGAGGFDTAQATENTNTDDGGIDGASAPVGATLGHTIGDVTIAINKLSEVRDIWRINNNYLTANTLRPNSLSDANRDYTFTGELPLVTVWAGKKHYVTNYREVYENPGYIADPQTSIYRWQDDRVNYSETNFFAIVDLVEISEVELTFGDTNQNTIEMQKATWPRLVDYGDDDSGLSEAKVRQVGNTGAYGTVKIAGTDESYLKLYKWSGVNFNNTGALEIWLGDPADPDPATGSWTALEDQNGDPIIPASQFERDTNLTTQTAGIAAPVEQDFSGTITLRTGLQDGAPAKITIDISTCRVTSHDFLDIGSGSYNQSNYPNVILGYPASAPIQENEVIERNKGRVFYMSTDQDGIFRVGRFFTVDQGTGTVTFAASIALSDVDGIGFKRGVVVTEFSTDSAMADNADDAVPVESAIRGYINRRLGYDQAGNQVPQSDLLGPPVLQANGSVAMTGDLKMNGNTIVNIAPVVLGVTAGTTAVNKDYVDLQTQGYSQAADLRDVEVTTAGANMFLGFANTKTIWLSTDAGDNGANADFTPTASYNRILTSSDGSAFFGTIIGRRELLDTARGNVVVITYTVGTDEFNEVPYGGSSIIYEGTTTFNAQGVPTGTVTASDRFSYAIAGPYAEMINIVEEPFVSDGNEDIIPVSDITIGTRRLPNDTDYVENFEGDYDAATTYNNGQVVFHNRAYWQCNSDGTVGIEPTNASANANWTVWEWEKRTDPTAFYDLQINDEVIVDQDVNPYADIQQFKLKMTEADNFVLSQTDIPTEIIAEATVGYTYEIVDLGTIDQTQWNTIAGTSGDTYVAEDIPNAIAGSQFTYTSATTNTSGIVRRVISSSTLPLSGVTDRANQATLGLATFDMANFKVTRGYTQIKDNGITLGKIEKLSTQTVIGNPNALLSTPEEVTFNTVVDDGGGLLHTDLGYTSINGPTESAYISSGQTPNNDLPGVLTRTDNEEYYVVPYTTEGQKNSFVKTDDSSSITATAYNIGTGGTPTVLSTNADDGLALKNTSGGTILTSAGGMSGPANQNGPTVKIPGNVNIGKMGDPDVINLADASTGTYYEIYDIGTTTQTAWNTAAGTSSQTYKEGDVFLLDAIPITVGNGQVQEANNFSRSQLQTDSVLASTSPWIASDWVYTSFIESPREDGANSTSTGISIGYGSGKGGEGQIAFVVANDPSGNVTPVTIDRTGIFNDGVGNYNIGTSANRYNKLYVDDIDMSGNIILGADANAITDNAGALNSLYTVGSVGSTNWNTKAGVASPAVGDIVRINSTGGNGTGTLIPHQIILNEDTGDGYFAGDVITDSDLYVKNIVNKNSTGNGTIGSSSVEFAGVYATMFYGTATAAQFADLAENYLGDADYEPGTVLVFGGDAEVTVTDKKGDHRVAGVVTTNPAHLMNSALEGDHVVGLALQGRVPCNVIGEVRKGDILVTSAIPGYAIVNNTPGVGTVIGKAVGTKETSDRGVVEVVVGRV